MIELPHRPAFRVETLQGATAVTTETSVVGPMTDAVTTDHITLGASTEGFDHHVPTPNETDR